MVTPNLLGADAETTINRVRSAGGREFSLLARERGGYGAFITQLAGYVDGYITEDHEGNVLTTRIPIETGASLTDHAAVEPQIVTLDGWVSDVHQYKPRAAFESATQTFPSVPLGERAGRAAQELERLRVARTPITIYTHLGVKENMLLVRVRERTGPSTGRGMRCTLEFQGIDFVDLTRREEPAAATGDDVPPTKTTRRYELRRYNDLALWQQPFLPRGFTSSPPPTTGFHEFPFVSPRLYNLQPLIEELENSRLEVPVSRLAAAAATNFIIGGPDGETAAQQRQRQQRAHTLLVGVLDAIRATHGNQWRDLKLTPQQVWSLFYEDSAEMLYQSDGDFNYLQTVQFRRLTFFGSEDTDVHEFSIHLNGFYSYLDNVAPVSGTNVPVDRSRNRQLPTEQRILKLTFTWVERLGRWQCSAETTGVARHQTAILGQKLINSSDLPVDMVIVPVLNNNARYTHRASNRQSGTRLFDDDDISIPLSFEQALNRKDSLTSGNFAVLLLNKWQGRTWQWPPAYYANREYNRMFNQFIGRPDSGLRIVTPLPQPVPDPPPAIPVGGAVTYLWLSETDTIPSEIPVGAVSGYGALTVPDFTGSRFVFIAQLSNEDDITRIRIVPGPSQNDFSLWRPKRTVDLDRNQYSLYISDLAFGFTLSGLGIVVGR